MQIRRAIPGRAAYMGLVGFMGLAAFLLTAGSLSSAQAQVPAFRFGGEQFVQKFDVKGLAPNRQVASARRNRSRKTLPRALGGWSR